MVISVVTHDHYNRPMNKFRILAHSDNKTHNVGDVLALGTKSLPVSLSGTPHLNNLRQSSIESTIHSRADKDLHPPSSVDAIAYTLPSSPQRVAPSKASKLTGALNSSPSRTHTGNSLHHHVIHDCLFGSMELFDGHLCRVYHARSFGSTSKGLLVDYCETGDGIISAPTSLSAATIPLSPPSSSSRSSTLSLSPPSFSTSSVISSTPSQSSLQSSLIQINQTLPGSTPSPSNDLSAHLPSGVSKSLESSSFKSFSKSLPSSAMSSQTAPQSGTSFSLPPSLVAVTLLAKSNSHSPELPLIASTSSGSSFQKVGETSFSPGGVMCSSLQESHNPIHDSCGAGKVSLVTPSICHPHVVEKKKEVIASVYFDSVVASVLSQPSTLLSLLKEVGISKQTFDDDVYVRLLVSDTLRWRLRAHLLQACII